MFHNAEKGIDMGIEDKIRNTVDDATGKAKEALGNLTGDEKLESEGDRDQSKADLSRAKENVKDAVKE
jgi:uncharacterized protein YjbJ (UPF0337 family)